MEMDRLTRSRKPLGYDRPAAASRAYLKNCRTMDRYVDMAADKIMECKWRAKTTKRGYTYLDADMLTVEYVGECVAEVTDWDGDWDRDAVEAYADRVALAVLKRHGYRVAADADYDWVVDNIGLNAEGIYSDAWNIVAEEGPDNYSTDRY